MVSKYHLESRNALIAEMKSVEMKKVTLSVFDFKTIEHQEDASLRAKMDAIPMFKSFMMDTICTFREKYISIESDLPLKCKL